MDKHAENLPRVCIITHSGYPVEPRARRMAEALAGHGFAVDVICLRLSGQAARETIGHVNVVRLPVARHQGAGTLVYLGEYARFFLLAARRLVQLHRGRPYALVQVHNPPDALVFATLPLKLRGVPVLLDLRELMPELFMSRFGLARRSAVVRLLTLLERWACAYADAVLVLHDRHRRIMEARHVSRDKLSQVMNCPDERIFDPARLPADRTREDGRFIVLYHGGIMARYGVDLLVEAVARIRAQVPGIRLEIYGTGDLLPRVKEQVAALRIEDIVTFHGQRPLEEMPAAIAAADVGVAPMRQDVFTDCGLPTKLLEYVTLGLPAVTSRTATTADYFDESMVGLFRPGDADDLADKLLAVYRDPESAAARARRARRFPDTHNWPGERAVYLKVVRGLTGA